MSAIQMNGTKSSNGVHSNSNAEHPSSNGSQPSENPATPGYQPATEPVWLGVSSPRPKPRVIGSTLFGHVDDAFDSKSIKVGEETPYARRERLKAEAKLKQEEEEELERKLKELEELKRKEEEMARVEQRSQALASSCIDEEKDLPKMIIRGGRVINEDQSFEAEVYIVGNKIKSIGTNLEVGENVSVIDAKNCLIMPGGIDTNTQFGVTRFGLKSVDDFYNGTKLALAGGTTTIVDCLEVGEGAGEGLLKSYEKRTEEEAQSSCCDYCLCVEVPDWNEAVEKEMEVLAKEKGVSCFRVNPSRLSDSSLYKFFKKCSELGSIAQVIPNSAQLNKELERETFQKGITGPEGILLSHPEQLEGASVNRTILLADQAGAPVYIGSITGKTSADLVALHRRKGRTVLGEVCCAALTQDSADSCYHDNRWLHAASHVTDPPLRPNTSACLTNHLAVDGLQMVGSSHCTFSAEQKASGKDDFRLIPPGLNGAAERMAVVWNEAVVKRGMDPCRFVAIISSNPAKMFNIYPTKGRIAEGSDADIIVWCPDGKTEISAAGQLSTSDLNIFDGQALKGSLQAVLLSGAGVLLPESGLNVSKGQGKYISTACNSEFAYGKIHSKQQALKNNLQPIERDLKNLSLSEKGDSSEKGTTNEKTKELSPDDEHVNKYHCRPATSSGGRNMQDTTFSLSGTSYCARLDDKPGKKGCGYKVNQPPGGSTTQLW